MNESIKYPGVKTVMDGNTAAIMCERESTDGAGAYPITPSTQMGEYWAEEAAKGHLNISDRPLIFIEPEGEHAAAAVTAGLSMTGLRAANFSSGQGIAYMHESLYAAVGKRLTYVLNIGARAMTKSTLNVHAGHDDYHAIDDTGFFQLFAKNVQHVADLNIIAHRIAELALTPGVIAQDGFLTTHLIESLYLPERNLIRDFLGRPDDIIDTPTPAQKIIYGDQRRRIPEVLDVINVPGLRSASTFSNSCCFISRFSITTSTIQSTSLIFCRSSSKLPVVICLITFCAYTGEGFCLIAACKLSFTSLLRRV